MKLLAVVTIVLMFTASNHVAAEEENLIMDHGAMHAPDLCDAPTANLTIAVDGQNIAFAKSTYHVEKNTCYTFTFENPSGIEHDVTVEAVAGQIGFVHMHVVNATVGPHHDGSVSQNVMTPNMDVTYKMFCEIAGHDAAGMHSQLVVGQGSSDTSKSPGFGLFTLSFAIVTLAVIEKQRKSSY